MEVIKLNNNAGKLTATSREIARVTAKQHKHVMRDIEDEFEVGPKLGSPNKYLTESTYKDKSNRDSKMYILTKRGAIQLMTRYSKEVRTMVLDEFERMEEYIKAQQSAPMTVEQLLAANAQMIGELQNKVIEMKPKADFFDQVADSKTALNMDQVAKTHGIGRNKLFAFLRDQKILMANNMPYQAYIDNGWFRVIEQKYQKPNGEQCINVKTLVYQKGSAGIGRLLSAK